MKRPRLALRTLRCHRAMPQWGIRKRRSRAHRLGVSSSWWASRQARARRVHTLSPCCASAARRSRSALLPAAAAVILLAGGTTGRIGPGWDGVRWAVERRRAADAGRRRGRGRRDRPGAARRHTHGRPRRGRRPGPLPPRPRPGRPARGPRALGRGAHAGLRQLAGGPYPPFAPRPGRRRRAGRPRGSRPGHRLAVPVVDAGRRAARAAGARRRRHRALGAPGHSRGPPLRARARRGGGSRRSAGRAARCRASRACAPV